MKIKRQNILYIIIIVSSILRFGTALYLGDSLFSEQQVRIYDQISYDALARSIIEGDGYTFEEDWYPGFTKANHPTAHWSFLYPLFLVGVYKLFGYHPLAARLIQAGLASLLSTWLVYRLGRRLFNESVGLLASGLMTIYAYFIFYDAALMTEPFYIVGVLAMMELSLAIIEKQKKDGDTGKIVNPSIGWWLGLGAVLGTTSLLRQTILFWLPILFLWFIWAGNRRSHLWGPVISIISCAIIILPWTIRNYVIYDSFLLLNSNAGYALYSANHPDHGTQFDQDYAAPLPDDLLLRRGDEAQWNTALTKRGLEFIQQDLSRFLLLSLDRVGIFYNFWFSSESDPASNIMRVLSFGLYLPFFLLGLFLSFRCWKQFSLIYLFIVVFSLLHIFTWASVRYRLPIDAILMPFAGLSIYSIWCWLINRSFIKAVLHKYQT